MGTFGGIVFSSRVGSDMRAPLGQLANYIRPATTGIAGLRNSQALVTSAYEAIWRVQWGRTVFEIPNAAARDNPMDGSNVRAEPKRPGVTLL
jgi:hypothetical protein